MAKMITCKHCKQQIAKSAKTCPHCGGANKSAGSGCLTFIVALIIIIGIAAMGANRNKSNSETNTSTNTSANNAGTSTTTKQNEVETTVPFSVASKTTELKIGEVAKAKKYYAGLACVRTLNHVQTAIDVYTKEVAADHEVLYTIVEVYNSTEEVMNFNRNSISLYVDSVQASGADVAYLVAIDDYKQYQSYSIDPGKKALVVEEFEVTKGWKEAKVFVGDCSWDVTPSEVKADEYKYNTLMDVNNNETETKKGSEIYSKDYKVVYDNCEFYNDENMISATNYVVFEFTITNTGSEEIDYKLAGYKMRAYQDDRLLDDASYTINVSINGYTNIYDVDTIKAGMQAKVYVAFPIKSMQGDFTCIYDTGYITSEKLGTVVIKGMK